ncbi:uncharacterized protein LOC114452281 [Parambassis ranga]|uniref:Uncharacterized protein LOC114452281 n=1 Tax=Parambassis ranga TaxID=210632 RepID=A0A6P7KCX0_9TELE|nr:uncharacterized protein LOC114452281 [Parambassis ranga]
MATSSEFTGSVNLNGRLTSGLMMFLRLYDQQKDVFWQASGHFTQAAYRVSKKHKPVEDDVTKGLFCMFGGTVGAVCGVVTGGIWGALGAVGTATSIRLFESVNAASVTVGFFGSVLGGAVGGVFSGAIGSAINVVAHVSGHPVHGVITSAAWFTVGFVTGGAIGSTFGGLVGAAGGALGGGLGAVHATTLSIYLVESMISCPETNEKEKLMEKKNQIQKTGEDFSKSIRPLVEQLKTVQTILDGDKMAASHAVKSAAGQTEKTLTAVILLEKSLSDVQGAADPPQFCCSVGEAARQCEKIPEELKKMRAAVQKVLDSLNLRQQQ